MEKERSGIKMFLLQKLDFQKVQMFCLLHIKSKNKQAKCISEIQESNVLSHFEKRNNEVKMGKMASTSGPAYSLM